MAESLPDSIDHVLVIEQASPFGPADPDTIAERKTSWDNQEVLQGRRLQVEQSLPTVEATAELLSSMVEDDTLIEVLGGDGTFSNVYIALSQLALGNPTHTVGGGGACCIASELHPEKDLRTSPAALFSDGVVVPHRPLQITAEHSDLPDGDPRRRLQAVGFFSIGFSADMARRFNDEDFRGQVVGLSPNQRFIKQAKEIGRQVRLANKSSEPQQFTLEDNAGERQLTEMVTPNGNIMAKVIRFKGTRLLKDGYGRMEVADPLSHSLLPKVWLKARFGRYDPLPSYSSQEFRITTYDEDSFTVETDGEVFSYPSGTDFKIEQVEGSVNLITTDPKTTMKSLAEQ